MEIQRIDTFCADVKQLEVVVKPLTCEVEQLEAFVLTVDADEVPEMPAEFVGSITADEIDLDAIACDLLNDPDAQQMLRDSEKELAAISADSSKGK